MTIVTIAKNISFLAVPQCNNITFGIKEMTIVTKHCTKRNYPLKVDRATLKW